ncbi:DUF2490 domain-containing protein [Rhodocytophaga aerolata]|uniref:DUF2490 domain-containing protein n=1 Tax=Rhodocytophaga aerolata TaxID=455078 RepID=A0ABT8RA66_9BACT|nr:DUF2490 domain-containing protein [Rhodocytophaga aerolata]MDO1448148.1 DUF2490 domain-containing protein [Rhodocytophaga aerolata]
MNKRMWKMVGMIFLLFNCQFLFAQAPVNYTHFTYWSRLTVSKLYAKKWEFAAEYQHRRQTYREDDLNLMQAPLLHSFRVRARYTVSDALTFAVIPFTYFYASPLLGNERDYMRKPDKEYRFAGQAEFRQKIGKTEVLNRYGYESRFIKRPPDSLFRYIGRIRVRLLLEHPFFSKTDKKETFRPYASGEVFLNTGAAVEPTRIFEHTRLMTGIRFPISAFLRVDAGYQYAFRVRRTGFEKDHEHTLFTYFVFQL